MAWRLGIDLGTNSLGWWAFRVSKEGKRWKVTESLGGGVYIFPDGREPAKGGRVGDSNAVARRLARGMRRTRDRRKTRQRAFIRELIELGLMPSDPSERKVLFQMPKKPSDPERYNPYRLRAEALTQKLEPYELGRALFHMSLRRGFKSNRNDLAKEEGGGLKDRISGLQDHLTGQTLGQFLWDRYQAEKKREEDGNKAGGIRFRGDSDFYPSRSMYSNEFDAIQSFQAKHHSLSDEDWRRLRDRYVLFQWPLKPVERGSCEFFPAHQRHWKDTPIGHDFRIYQEVNNLRWIDENHGEHALGMEQRVAVLDLLMSRKSEVKFTSIRKEKLSDGSLLFPDCIRFNLESEKRKALKPHAIGATLASHTALSSYWVNRSGSGGDDGFLDSVFETLQEEADPESLELKLLADYDLSSDVIEALKGLHLSRATASVSRTFMETIVPIMRDQGLAYWDAVQEIFDEEGNPLHHSHRPGHGDESQLPYYGKILRGSMLGADASADPIDDPEKHFGRINNPTVHVALNCLRRVCNNLIERFREAPVEIHVELARDLKQTRKQRDEATKRQAANERENDRIRSELQKCGIAQPSALDVKKVKLWEELGQTEIARRCPFSGKTISFSQLINGEAEFEHILPFKRTLDDSMANLTVAMRWANRLKGNRTPYEAFATDAHKGDGIEWENVRARAETLPNKSWRFGPDAMDRFKTENNFIARQLTDNAYIARSAQQYLRCLKGVEQIVPNRGSLTAMLRGKWRLNGILSDDNRKTREDHRHHAIDAAVIGLADRGTLNEVSRLTARGADDRTRIEVPDLPVDIEQAIRRRVPEIIVVYKPDHGTQGGMFKDTAYGFIEPDNRDPDFPEHNLVVRKPLIELTGKKYKTIRDPLIRAAVKTCLSQAEVTGEKPEKTLVELGHKLGVKSVRILVKDQTVEPVPSAPYKGYKPDAYVCCDIWRLPKGKPGHWKKGKFEWKGVYWSHSETPDGVPKPGVGKPHPAARFVTRLFKNDMIAYEDGDYPRVARVAGFSTTNNKLDVVPHNIADPKQTYVSINILGEKGLRKLHASPGGAIRGLNI